MQFFCKNYEDGGFSIALQHPVSKRTLFPTNMCPAKLFRIMTNIVLALLKKIIILQNHRITSHLDLNTQK